MTIKAVCIHVHMSDNRRKLCDAEHSWLPVDVDIGKRLCDAEHSWLPVDVDNRTLCKSGLHTKR